MKGKISNKKVLFRLRSDAVNVGYIHALLACRNKKKNRPVPPAWKGRSIGVVTLESVIR